MLSILFLIVEILLRNISKFHLNPLSANPIKSSNALKQFVGNLLTNCFGVFDHFVKLVLKVLKILMQEDFV